MKITPLKIKTLIADDEPLARERLRKLLEAEPEIALLGECADGRAAVRAIQEQSPDLVFLDVQMPELDGYSTVRQLRASGYRGRIIALTGNVVEDDRGRCLDAGCDDHAIKPIAREQLLALVASKAVRTA